MSNKVASSTSSQQIGGGGIGTASASSVTSSSSTTPSPASVGSGSAVGGGGGNSHHHHGQISGAQKDEIINAIVTGNLDQVKRLVATAELVNIKDRSGNTLLHLATNNERTAIAKYLVSMGADVNAHCNGHTVLASALNRGNFELFEFYLAHKADCIGRNQLNLVHEAVNQQRADIVNTLIGRGADPNLYNSVHVTPLSIACAHRNLEICMILMENGACANLPDKKGNTALHVACGTASTELIECLLANTECDLRLKNACEETPLDLLFLAYLRDNKRPSEELVRRLVRAGALFSMPWNYTLTATNAPSLILFFAYLCKLAVPSLVSLFLNDKPFFADLITRGYWPNSLLVAIRSCMIESQFKSSLVELKEIVRAIDVITSTNQFRLKGSDLLSTLYTCEDATVDMPPQDPSTDFQLYRHVRHLYTHLPLPLKVQCRNRIRALLFSSSTPLHDTAVDDPSSIGDDPTADLLLIERAVQTLENTSNGLDESSRHKLVDFLALAEFNNNNNKIDQNNDGDDDDVK